MTWQSRLFFWTGPACSIYSVILGAVVLARDPIYRAVQLSSMHTDPVSEASQTCLS